MKPRKEHLGQIYLGQILNFVCCLIAWIIAIPVIPLVTLGLIPLYLYRQAVLTAAKIWRKDLLENLKFHDMVFALDKFYVRPYASNVKVFIVQGPVTLDEIKANFMRTILNKRVKSANEEESRLKFQRFHQFPQSFGLFYFWKNIENFDVNKHFRVEDTLGQGGGAGVTRLELCQYLSKLMTRPFPVGSALWEVVLVSKYEGEGDKCAVILRLHHILADGYTFNNVVDDMIGQKSRYTVKPEQEMTRGAKLKLLWNAPAWTIQLGMEELFLARNNWTSRHKKSREGVLGVTQIPLDYLKLIRKKADCHFATIGLCILTGALRRLFLETHSQSELPKSLKIMHFLPKPAHPMDYMCNHWRVGPFKVLIDTESALERLRKAETFFRNYTENHYWRIMDFQCELANLIPAPFYDLFLGRNYSTSIAFSNLPGYHEPAQLWGHDIKDVYKICGLQYRQTALAAAAYSHNGTVAYTVFANQDVVPTTPAAHRLTEVYLHQELRQLVKELDLESNPV